MAQSLHNLGWITLISATMVVLQLWRFEHDAYERNKRKGGYMAGGKWLGDDPSDMEWLVEVHGAPHELRCAILYGNEDSPDRIEGWKAFNPHHTTPPDWIYLRP